jgi:hypothetical protein
MEVNLHVVHTGDKRNTYKILAEEPERKRPFWIRRRRWEDNIDTNIKIRCHNTGWIHLVQVTNGGSCKHGNESSGSMKAGCSLTTCDSISSAT